MRSTLLTDAAFVLCSYTDPNGISTDDSYRIGSAQEEGDSSEGEALGSEGAGASQQALIFRIAPEVSFYGGGRKRRRTRQSDLGPASPVDAAAAAGSNASTGAEGADGAAAEAAARVAAAEAAAEAVTAA